MSRQKSDYSILAVDDCDMMASLIRILVEGEGYHFHIASSASVAIELIKQQHFDLVLMDIEMPEMSGLELLRELNQQSLLKDLKVVMLTGKTDVEHVEQCMKLGAKGYISKPFDRELMKNRIWEVIQDS